MSGARALTKSEHELIKTKFYSLRNKCLYLLGKNTGFRISELLSINVKDIYKKDYVKVTRSKVKGKTKSREIILNNETKLIVSEYIETFKLDLNSPLFISREGVNRPITRFMAHKILKEVFNKAGLQGTCTTHSMRKTFALNVFKKSGNNLLLTKHALGHNDLSTTIKYLPIDQEEIDSIILNDC